MKNTILILLLIGLCYQITLAKSKPKSYLMNFKQKIRIKDVNYLYGHYNVYEIEDFEDGDITENPTWAFFGKLNHALTDNKKGVKWTGKHSLHLTGKAKNFYIAGATLFMNQNINSYQTLKLSVKNNSKKDFFLQIELFDDDNFNTVIEVAKKSPDIVTQDDKFIYKQVIEGKQWEILYIPLRLFADVNPNVGDNIWNPSTRKGSGGLVQMQFLFICEDKKAEIDVELDNIKLLKQKRVR